jgi:hypothetical protein
MGMRSLFLTSRELSLEGGKPSERSECLLFNDLERVTCGAQCWHFSFAKNILEMAVSSLETWGEKINKKIVLQMCIESVFSPC